MKIFRVAKYFWQVKYIHLYEYICYKNLFLRKNQTDHVQHLILAWEEKGEVISDKKLPPSFLSRTTIQTLGTNSGTKLKAQKI